MSNSHKISPQIHLKNKSAYMYSIKMAIAGMKLLNFIGIRNAFLYLLHVLRSRFEVVFF